MRKFLAFVILCLFSFNSMAAPITDKMPDKMQQFMNNLNRVSASFNQTKILPESTKRFISSGYVKFVKGEGLRWQQQKPTSETFISTLDTYCVNGNSEQLNELPYFYRIQSMIDNMLSGDMSDFLFAFNADFSENKNGWTLFATPRLSAIADMVQDLTAYGNDKDLNKIVMTYTDGTIIILEFKRLNKELPDEIKC